MAASKEKNKKRIKRELKKQHAWLYAEGVEVEITNRLAGEEAFQAEYQITPHKVEQL